MKSSGGVVLTPLAATADRLRRLDGDAGYLNGKALSELSTLDVAKVLGLLPQTPVAPDGITGADLVSRALPASGLVPARFDVTA